MYNFAFHLHFPISTNVPMCIFIIRFIASDIMTSNVNTQIVLIQRFQIKPIPYKCLMFPPPRPPLVAFSKVASCHPLKAQTFP